MGWGGGMDGLQGVFGISEEKFNLLFNLIGYPSDMD